VPVIAGAALSIEITLNASLSFPCETNFKYSGICCSIGHPTSVALHGDLKQSNKGKLEPDFLDPISRIYL